MATVLSDAEGSVTVGFAASPWDALIPYRVEDVEGFAAGSSAAIAVRQVRVERDRRAPFTADVFLHDAAAGRRLVLQFASVYTASRFGPVTRIEVPPAFTPLSFSVLESVGRAVERALRDVASRPDEGVHVVTVRPGADGAGLEGLAKERMVPGLAWNELFVHSAKRYVFASELVRGLRVLDLGCGTGYGSKILARTAREVVRADPSRAALEYADETYPDPKIASELIPYVGAAQSLPFADHSFDAIVSFEVVEHIPPDDLEVYFEEVGRLLRPDGILLISTPNKRIYINYPDPHHVSLMELADFRRLLESRFDDVRLLGQLRRRGLPHTAMEFEIVPHASPDQEIFLGVCRRFSRRRPIFLPSPTVWIAAPPGAETKACQASPTGLAGGAASREYTADGDAPGWWIKLWQRLRPSSPGTVICLGRVHPDARLAMEREGWRAIGGGEGDRATAHSLVSLDGDWCCRVDSLRNGGAFLIGVSRLEGEAEEWRRALEKAFEATVHLLDPGDDSGWLFAFGWKGERVEPLRRNVLMTTHRRALAMFGGGETQMLETLVNLRHEGVRCDISVALRLAEGAYDLIHVFSLYHSEKLGRLLGLRKPLVISPIFMDLSETLAASETMKRIFSAADEGAVRESLALWREGAKAAREMAPPVLAPGQRELLERADLVLPNSRKEAVSLQQLLGELGERVRIIPNGVSSNFLGASPSGFAQRYGLIDFVLCAGRIETLKNQLMLIWALRDTGLPLVLAGPVGDPSYAALCSRWAGPNVRYVSELSRDMLASAYAAARVHVLPSWIETTGLVNLEAGLAGCNLVVGNRGAEAEYLGEHAYVCDPGDPDSIREAVLRAWEGHSTEGVEARRQHILSRYSWRRVAALTAEAYEDVLGRKARPRRPARHSEPRTPAIVWEGPQFVHHSLALVNGELCSRLMEAGVELSLQPVGPDQLVPREGDRWIRLAERIGAPLSRAADVRVRHHWPPNLAPVRDEKLVLILPWEFGSVPKGWVEPINSHVGEVWVPSSFVRQCFVQSGVRPDRVHVVPNGVDASLFRPEAPPLPLPGDGSPDRPFRFLFVGGVIWRKGIDVLLAAYASAFGPEDNVCLVIKDMGARTFYADAGRCWRDLIREFQRRADLPKILYLDQDLPAAELPGLYTACDCLVHPYRGEGFGLPIAEAMACGLPVIVTGAGASLDFCNGSNSYLIPAAVRRFPEKHVDGLETVDYPWVAEPDPRALAALMRYVYEHQSEARSVGAAASRDVRSSFTWESAASVALGRIEAMIRS